MKKNINSKIIILSGIVIFFLIIFSPLFLAHAAQYVPLENIPGFENVDISSFPNYVLAIYKFGIWTVGIAAMLMITIGGFVYFTSAGNTSKAGTGKKIVTDALIGLMAALFAYLILFIINPDLVNIRLSGFTIAPGAAPSGVPTTPTPVGKLAVGCNNYASAFSSAAGGDKNLQCLLIGIANAESGCDPNKTSSHNACGLMQIVPATGNTDCNSLLSNPNNSIQIAKNLLVSSSSKIQTHPGFDIGASYGLSGKTVTYGSYVYDTGNDDLIASYNAGSGKIAATPGKAGPFVVSVDCPSPVTPAWQCQINPGGFAETQNYVMRVQQFQRQCLAN